MHELSLTQNLLDIIEEHAASDAFERVNSLRLSYGRLSCIDPGALEFSFSVLARGTRAQGARLMLEALPVVIYCFSCERDFEIDSFPDSCPHCQGQEILLRAGTEELRLIEMDVD